MLAHSLGGALVLGLHITAGDQQACLGPQQWESGVDVIENHERRGADTAVLNAIAYEQRASPGPGRDLAAQPQVLAIAPRLAHRSARSQQVFVSLPARLNGDLLRRRRPDAPVHAQRLALIHAGRADLA